MCGMLHIQPCRNISCLVWSNDSRITSPGREDTYSFSRRMNSCVSEIVYCVDSQMLLVIRSF
jgi:hypothetical protein